MGRSKIDYFEILSGVFLLLILFIILIIASLGDHKIFLVLIGFFPSILTVMISLILHEQYQRGSRILWSLPILTSAGFYALQYIPGFGLENLDIPVLTGVNFIISIVYVIFVFGAFRDARKPHDEQKRVLPAPPVYVEPEKSIEDIIHSIEDKSKALNFAIGRVYNKYHGGTKEMRDKLKIPAEWYNEFSLIGFGTDHIDYGKLKEIITKFELHLNNFEKTELELFKTKITSLKNLIRDPAGKDKVIDVLDHNDKDPVSSYYEGAVSFCKKIQEQMENNELTLVENKYIPKDEEEEEELKLSSGAAEPAEPKTEKESETIEIRRPRTGYHP